MNTQIIETVNIGQAKEAVAQSIHYYFARNNQGRYTMDRRRARPICLMGPPGIGKTEVVRQVAQEQGLAFLSYSITHHTRQSIIGLPRLVEGQIDGRTVSMTEYTMSEIVAQVYRTMEATGKQEGILFLDEFNCASESLRPIMLQLLQDKSFGPHPIPEGWMLVLAGNPPEYNRGASELDPVTADRMRLIHVEPDYGVWRSYAKEQNIHPMVLSYLDTHPEHFYQCERTDEGMALVTARGWEDLSCLLRCMDQTQQLPSLALVAQYIQSGTVARSFFQHWTQYAIMEGSGLPDQVLSGLPAAIQAVKRMSDSKAWCLVSGLMNRLTVEAAHTLELDTTVAAVHAVLKDLRDRMNADPEVFEAQRSSLAVDAADIIPKLTDLPAREFLSRSLITLAQEGWEPMKAAFENQLHQPLLEASDQFSAHLTNAIQVCRRALEGQPQLEFLMNGLCASHNMVEMLSRTRNEAFEALYHDTYFDPASAVGQLLEMLDGQQATA